MRDEELTQLDNLNHSRRYSYSDLLRKPRPVDLIYRLWNQGSATIFAWGDPDYASRFVNSCALGSSASFEIAAPLSMKGGHAVAHREPWRLHADPELQSDSWEDERYWFWYLVFGRLGYSAAVDPAVWRREFDRRFGRTATPHVERAFTSASRVLPLITAFHMPKHPMLHYWPEMSTGAALFAENNIETSFRDVSYSHAEPSDPGLFYSIVNYVADLTTDSVRGKYTPLQVAAWLADLSAQITAALERCEQIGQLNDNREFQAARRDFLMLADLASYHSHKARAAVELELSSPAGRAEHLPAAHRHMTHARDVWHSLAVRGGETYCANLEFGAGSSTARRGNWSERQVEIDADIAQLERTMADADIAVGSGNGSKDAIQRAPVFHPSLECDLPDRHSPHADLRVELRSTEEDAPVDVCMHFRHPNQLEGRFQQLPMTGTGNTFHATIPASYITDEWDLLIYFSCLCSNEPALFPGINNPQHPLPYFIVDVGD
jgi:hypothetical protein